MEGFENVWHEGGGYMFVAIRFFNDSGDQIGQEPFPVSGESAGWNGSIRTSALAHRREILVVPPKAAHAWVFISSAGPPATTGIYVVANLVVTGTPSNLPPTMLIQSPFDHQYKGDLNRAPKGWMRDGSHPSMAKILEIGQDPQVKAFAIEDEDPSAHAEWRNMQNSAATVSPGEWLTVEWNEMFSIGVSDFHAYTYASLPPGSYHFHVIGLDIMGMPTGDEAMINVLVPQPFWKRPWFFGGLVILTAIMIMASGRYLIWQRIQREMMRLKSQQALECERLRIAQDIHDDLGARVTQISLVSAMSQNDTTLSEKARANFERITKMSRDLVAALYETVWAVNPEYDNLDALGNYLCQVVNQLCEPTPFRCRLHVMELPRETQVSSQIRHNFTMIVKEAINNAIKHSKASELTLEISFANDVLDIAIQDNGCGIHPLAGHVGHGLANMKRRMANIGGSCIIESNLDEGTVVRMRLAIKHSDQARKTNHGQRSAR